MCGILALFNQSRPLALSEEELNPALRELAHRGPDDEGCVSGPHAFLGHRRLAITDLSSAGRQPMQTAEGAVSLIFNGQIFNWRDLRCGLEARGYRFKSDCDTECILHGYKGNRGF